MISVIIPTYNRANSIEKAINSILNQTYEDIELLIIDDNSIDNTEDIVEKFNDKRIRYYKLSENKGACYARNYGIQLAKGEYIAFQDSDDEWRSNKLAEQYKYLIEKNLDVVSCFILVKNGEQEAIFPKKIKNNNYKNMILRENFISTQTIFGKKECFYKEKFDDRLPRFQDWDLAIRLVNRYKIGIIEKVLVDVYIQSNSISKDCTKAIRATNILLEKYKDIRKLQATMLRLRGIYKMQNGEYSVEDFRKAFFKDKSNVKNIFDYIISIFQLRSFHYKFYLKRGVLK
ncbi:glycosyltransferase family 2 protein [Clostridium sp. SM-530-WT-3G]|uniref:glycosyltransferase family 2 protein n=1 Tax=Clostridium sp. SM-530-WT-3G TaxID=2725303 RepID=UPI00145E448D|nr:glycosyltransferase family 2 protein [Clostridium sp. SM-530-WT-3G]NME82449.1 glycosyltransferase family 2 protein [Clostridium sp. SM-530-WT-3G]